MDAPSTTPHDAVFKQFLMHAETARDFLDIHLPAELRELCDLDTLTRCILSRGVLLKKA